MGAAAKVLIWLLMTIFWALIGIGLPIIIPEKIDNRRLIQAMLALTAFFCYTFWLCTYLMQLNPLIAPEIKVDVAWAIVKEWQS
ncbi:V-type proton ATPase subunit e-like [Symsagittifera roscoffensis]|uniref:V-type proton ATPase subunit e-like n=1 Tax=Symsagittifera roscoffensis TaxID=84072 RepID=UPI00307C3D76